MDAHIENSVSAPSSSSSTLDPKEAEKRAKWDKEAEELERNGTMGQALQGLRQTILGQLERLYTKDAVRQLQCLDLEKMRRREFERALQEFCPSCEQTSYYQAYENFLELLLQFIEMQAATNDCQELRQQARGRQELHQMVLEQAMQKNLDAPNSTSYPFAECLISARKEDSSEGQAFAQSVGRLIVYFSSTINKPVFLKKELPNFISTWIIYDRIYTLQYLAKGRILSYN